MNIIHILVIDLQWVTSICQNVVGTALCTVPELHSVSHPVHVKTLRWLMYCAGVAALHDMALLLRYISLRLTREGGGEVQNTLH